MWTILAAGQSFTVESPVYLTFYLKIENLDISLLASPHAFINKSL